MDTRDIYKLVREFEEEKDDVINLYDSLDIELSEDFVIETGIVGFTENGVIVHLDEAAMEFLDFNGVLLESEETINEDQESVDAVYGAVLRRITGQHLDLLSKYGPAAVQAAIEDVAEFAGSGGLDEIGSSDVSIWVRQVIQNLEAGSYKKLHENPALIALGTTLGTAAATGAGERMADRVADKIGLEEGYGIVDAFKNKLSSSNDPFGMIYNAISGDYGEDIRKEMQDSYDDIVNDSGYRLHPDDDFEKIIELMVDQLVADSEDYKLDELADIKRLAGQEDDNSVEPVREAEYQGRKVPLNKPMQGDVKKSKVYVKKPNGKIVKVNFGDKNMRIKKSNPSRRKSFRARHNCDNPGPKWKARYWSCRAW